MWRTAQVQQLPAAQIVKPLHLAGECTDCVNRGGNQTQSYAAGHADGVPKCFGAQSLEQHCQNAQTVSKVVSVVL